MPTVLIGVHRSWSGQPLPRPLQDRFARALGIAGPHPAELCTVAETVAASTGAQRGWRPVRAADGSHVLFAGHIYNRHQLCLDLGIGNASDAALYAEGFSAWGEGVDLRAIGEFASIVIRPNGNEIRLARSPINAPPLNFWHDAERFIVASLPNAMFATGEVEQRIDEEKLADALFLNHADDARTVFAGVRSLPCGKRALASARGVAITNYYDIAGIPEVRCKDERDYVAQAHALFEEATRTALDGFNRPAISLSGGFDSQAVAAYAIRCRPGEPLEAFTGIPEAEWDGITYPSRFGNEQAHVEALAAIYPEIRTHWVDAKGLFLDHKLEAMFMLAGAPPANAANLHWIHESYSQARAIGCDVMLDASFGNVSFSFDGDGALPTLARSGRWLQFWKEAGHLGQRLGKPRFNTMVSNGLLPFAPAWLHRSLVNAGLVKFDEPFDTWCSLNRDYAATSGVLTRADAAGRELLLRNLRHSRQWRDSSVANLGSSANISQAMSLLHGIELRDPTSYRPLVEFCLGLPDEQFVLNGEARRLARRMLKGLVPDMVLQETRSGLQCADWHLRLGRQRGQIIAEIDRLANDQSVAAMIDLPGLKQALVDWQENGCGPKTPRLKLAVTRGITTARFIRFVSGRNE